MDPHFSLALVSEMKMERAVVSPPVLRLISERKKQSRKNPERASLRSSVTLKVLLFSHFVNEHSSSSFGMGRATSLPHVTSVHSVLFSFSAYRADTRLLFVALV